MFRRMLTSLAFFVASAFAILLTGAEPTQGQDKATKKAAQQAKQAEQKAIQQAKQAQKQLEKAVKQAQKQAAEVAKQEFNGREATALRQAYFLLTAANFNYNGHKAKAMAEVKAACEILDKRIIANGTAAQEATTMQQNAITAYVKANRSLAGKVTEPQVISDAQVYQAGVILDNLRAVMAANNQPRLKAHVDKAVTELKLALSTR